MGRERTKFLRTEVQSVLVLRTNLRNDKREPVPTFPPTGKLATIRTQPATIVASAHTEQARTAVGILDGFVHDNNPTETHRFDLLVRKVLTDEAGNLSVGLRQLAQSALGTNLLRNPIVVMEEPALEDGDLSGNTGGRLETPRTEHTFGVDAQMEAFAPEPFDPLRTGRAVGRDAEVDDAVFLAPSRSGDSHLHHPLKH